ncbi:MAG: VCBS repeat-containing protein [Acidobacteria bacterium]|nr:VCBS repeat-containing protein [Acidobacteriota bacterium]
MKRSILFGTMGAVLLSVAIVSGSEQQRPIDRALSVARDVLQDLAQEGMSGWTTDSRLAQAFPVHIEGLEGVSYYEVKVVTARRDAGYILVNVNGTDLLVAEITTEGPATTERFRKALGQDDLKIVRYDWFSWAAKAGSESASGILAVIGFDESSGVRVLAESDGDALRARACRFDADYRRRAANKGCVPYQDRAALDEYYLELAEGLGSDGSPMASRSQRPQDTYYRNYLRNVFRCDGGLPLAGDFDRDGRVDDVGTFDEREEACAYDYGANGSGNETVDRDWGEPEDLVVAGDFDRDGRVDDIAIFRPSDRRWYFDHDHDGDTDGGQPVWGALGDAPLAGDFDRDGYRDDVAVYRSSNMMWYYDYDHDGDTDEGPIGTWGLSGDRPFAGDFDRDGYADDVGVFRPGSGRWYFDYNHNDSTNATLTWGANTDQPIAGDFDNDGYSDDVAVFRPTDGTWYYNYNYSGGTDRTAGPWGPTGQAWRMPSWYQPESLDGYPVGCGNTAWAMVYAYWRHFKSKTALFGGLDLTGRGRASACDTGTIYNMMWDLADINETIYGGSGDDKWGLTWPYKMPQGIRYAQNCGYSTASVVRWRGDEREKFNAIETEIRDSDRPVILYIASEEGVHVGDHYVTIEGTVKIDRGWRSTAIGYLVNYGWSEYGSVTLKWIFTRPTSYDPHHSVYDAYLVRFD